MKTIRQINIKDRQGYFFNDMTNINDFYSNLLNIDQVVFESALIMYDIKYIKHLNSLNSLYLVFNNLDAYFEKNDKNKYLIFASPEKNKLMLGYYKELWDETEEQIELISGAKVNKYSKDFMKIRFESDDILPLGKTINIPECIIDTSSVFQDNNRYFPQVLLHDCFYEYGKDVNPLFLD